MCTFQVSDVEPGTARLPAALPELFAGTLEDVLGRRVEAAACNQADAQAWEGHPLVGAAHEAFTHHLPLVLSPDDVWLCLAQGFGTHVNLHAEELRERLGMPEEKVVIVVRRDDFRRGSAANDWPAAVAEYSERMGRCVGKVKDLVVADFSTTGAVEKTASQVALMSAMQPYFGFWLMTLCGIPSITLLGSVEDWQSVRRRADMFSDFGLEPWVRALAPVLDQFVAAAGGRVDREFWRSFYKVNQASGDDRVTGWINALFPYLRTSSDSWDDMVGTAWPRPNPYCETCQIATGQGAHEGPSNGEFPSGLSAAPFVWQYFDHEIAMELLGGFIGVSQDPKTLAVRPAIGWAVCEAAQEARRGRQRQVR